MRTLIYENDVPYTIDEYVSTVIPRKCDWGTDGFNQEIGERGEHSFVMVNGWMVKMLGSRIEWIPKNGEECNYLNHSLNEICVMLPSLLYVTFKMVRGRDSFYFPWRRYVYDEILPHVKVIGWTGYEDGDVYRFRRLK